MLLRSVDATLLMLLYKAFDVNYIVALCRAALLYFRLRF